MDFNLNYIKKKRTLVEENEKFKNMIIDLNYKLQEEKDKYLTLKKRNKEYQLLMQVKEDEIKSLNEQWEKDNERLIEKLNEQNYINKEKLRETVKEKDIKKLQIISYLNDELQETVKEKDDEIKRLGNI